MMHKSEFKVMRQQARDLERIADALERIAAFFEFFETAWAEADEITMEDEGGIGECRERKSR